MDILRLSNVSRHFNTLAGLGLCFHIHQLLQFFLFLIVSFLKSHILCYSFMIRINDDPSFNSIHNENIPILYSFCDVMKTHHCRNLQGSCHDGTMGGSSTDICKERNNLFLIQLRCIRRRQIMSNDNGIGFRNIKAVFNTCKIVHQSLGHVLDVRSTFSHILIFHGFEDRHIAAAHITCCFQSIEIVVLNLSFDGSDKLWIIKKHQMRIKDHGFFLSHGIQCFLLDFLQLDLGLFAGLS